MAKFCTKCGKELVDGKPCNCTENINTVVNTGSSVVNDVLNLVKGMFTVPVDTMKSFIQESNFNNALISIGINAVAVAIFICILCKEMIATLFDIIGMSNPLSFYMSGSSNIEIPYVKIALISIIVAIVMQALIAGIAYLMSAKLFKNQTSYKTMITWLGANAGLSTIVYLVTAVCLLINFQIALAVFVAGSILSICYMYKGLKFACDTDENKLAYILMPALLITTFVLVYIVPKIMM